MRRLGPKSYLRSDLLGPGRGPGRRAFGPAGDGAEGWAGACAAAVVGREAAGRRPMAAASRDPAFGRTRDQPLGGREGSGPRDRATVPPDARKPILVYRRRRRRLRRPVSTDPPVTAAAHETFPRLQRRPDVRVYPSSARAPSPGGPFTRRRDRRWTVTGPVASDDGSRVTGHAYRAFRSHAPAAAAAAVDGISRLCRGVRRRAARGIALLPVLPPGRRQML